jgi:peptidoglycan hydrolase-like protein with peptidoglycan-binding domain
MKTRIVVLVFICSAALLRADQTIESAQQALKDQGFYYGDVTGDKNADTTAAIRRYQIRNGLQITGDLNDETLRSLGVGSAGASQPIAKTAPTAAPDTSDLRAESSRETTAPENPAPYRSFAGSGQDRQVYPSQSAIVLPPQGGLFAGTPYETAPPEVQRNVVTSAQTVLARRGLYRGGVDGIYGPNMEFSLRAYQSRVGLPVTGRLDLETLAAMELLPGAHAPVFAPRQPVFREPPVRGEWVRP